jgi:hypothetical protein
MQETTGTRHSDEIKLVLQEHADTCGIACIAMIVAVSYEEACANLAPPPSTLESARAYSQRETAFLNTKGWWASAQLVLKTVVCLEDLDAMIATEERFKKTVESSQRLRLILAFSDGSKPDHSVAWDKSYPDQIFDPSRGQIPISTLFEDTGPQSYSGTLGFTAFSYQPGLPIQALIKTDVGFDAPAPYSNLSPD